MATNVSTKTERSVAWTKQPLVVGKEIGWCSVVVAVALAIARFWVAVSELEPVAVGK